MAASDERCIASGAERLSTELGDPRTAVFGDAQSRGALKGTTSTDSVGLDQSPMTNQHERLPWLDANGNVRR